MGEWECHTVEEVDSDKCYKHIKWAETQGRETHPEWYPEGTTFDNADTQCALFLKTNGTFNGDSHGCNLPPCSGISASMLNSTDTAVSQCIRPVAAPAPVVEAQGPSVEWWGWLLIVAAILGVGALIAFFMGLFGTKKPKKKRAIKAVMPPATEPEPAPVTTSVTAVPTYEVAPPVYTYAATAPIYEATQNIAVSAPAVVTSAPIYTGSVIQPSAMPLPMTSMVQAAPVSYSTVQAAPVISTISAAPVISTIAAAPVYTTAPEIVYQS